MLEDFQADVAITHAPVQESVSLRTHPKWRYRKVLYNQFLIVGPPDDPAHVGGLGAVEAMRHIAAGPLRFISRGDDSGTHERERQLWSAAEVTPPKDADWLAAAAGRRFIADQLRSGTLRGFTVWPAARNATEPSDRPW
jgi:tungstate transport system substrate-binding protein